MLPTVQTVHKHDVDTFILKITEASNTASDSPTYDIVYNGNYNLKLVGTQLVFSGDTAPIVVEVRSPALICNGGNQRYPVVIIPDHNHADRYVNDAQYSKYLNFNQFIQGSLQIQLYNVTNGRALDTANDNFSVAYLYFQIEKM